MRSTPQNIQAEQVVLGCIINDKEKLQEVEDVLTVEDFYLDKHRVIYESIKILSHKEIDVDLITLLEELNSKGIIEKCGGVNYVTEISSAAIYNDNVFNYTQIVKDKADRRKLIKAGRELIEKSYEDNEIQEVVNGIEDKLYQAISKDSGNIISASDAVDEVLKQIEESYKNGGKITGKTTGFKELDTCLSGLQKGDFIVVAARPSMGKTAFALNIGQYASKEAKVGIFSLEMPRSQLMQRLISSRCLVEFQNIKTGKLNTEQFGKIAIAANEIAKRSIYIDDESISIADIKSQCRNLKKKKGLDVVIIDYLQLIESLDKNYSREQEIAKISRELKKMAKKLDITVIALSQLSRAPEQRADHRPMLSDLRESGSIEQDADVIMFLYRDEYYNKESEEKNIAEVIVGKNRNGEVKTIKLGWVGQYQRFAPLDIWRG
ncbi:replicative DNA helicase [Clostridium chauvoei]|uniref:Replicative DNA helicase n=2 Tax=Clostridium chauvoei TaxID=46867 RepID=S6ELL9_9CLOT|nr:replicative DNA helicase [Clostridium chauvoei]ATD55424.1 replicative DNA helicase [Clostridium chauvoei]ATD56904.1 replicative DNA helicase [Clostridium chauvoei]MBX7280744.1 replicative DNA helicase [Clostridium chauvoei]MBX7283227.1 replicative DNA helicase [Clostridium chauvoei]MBX7285888.1 replicative DNA helicase [Clostridium chauvoei]